MSTVKAHYYSQHAGALRAELGAALSRDEMRDLHRKSAGAALRRSRRGSSRILAARDLGADPLRQSARSGCRSPSCRASRSSTSRCCCTKSCTTPSSSAATPRRIACSGLLYAIPSGISAEPVHALAPRPSRRARLRRGRSEARTTCRRRSTRAGTSCSTARRRCSRSTSAPRAASRRPIRQPLQQRDRRASASCRSRCQLSALALIWYFFGVLRGAAHQHRPGLLRLPDRLHAQPPRPALRHRPDRSGEVGHADAGATGSGTSCT